VILVRKQSQIAADIGAPQVTDRVIHVARQDLNKSLSAFFPLLLLLLLSFIHSFIHSFKRTIKTNTEKKTT